MAYQGPQTEGQLPIGYSASRSPLSAVLLGGGTTSITNAPGSITISSTGGGGGGFSSINVQTFTSSGTYTPTAGMVYCVVEVVGGGGGAGGAGNLTGSSIFFDIGGNGAGGGYAKGVFSSSTIGASQTVTIGSGGAGGSGRGTAGTAGGTTSLGALLSATGGGGGSAPATSTSTGAAWVAGGTAGTGSGGSVNLSGDDGELAYMFFSNGSGNGFLVGGGGNSFYGQGKFSTQAVTNPSSVSYNGFTGTGYGAGGSASACISFSSNLSATGGSGTGGIVIITEFVSFSPGVALAANLTSVASNVTGDGTVYQVVYSHIVNQIGGSNYNSSTGVYTFPFSGWYFVSTNVGLTGLTSSHTSSNLEIFHNGVGYNLYNSGNPGVIATATGTYGLIGATAILNVSASDTMYVNLTVSGSTKTVGVNNSVNSFLYVYQIF